MRMKPLVVLGVVLIVLGIATLVHPSISYKTNEGVVKVGPMQASVETRRVLSVPRALSGLALVVGVFLVFVELQAR